MGLILPSVSDKILAAANPELYLLARANELYNIYKDLNVAPGSIEVRYGAEQKKILRKFNPKIKRSDGVMIKFEHRVDTSLNNTFGTFIMSIAGLCDKSYWLYPGVVPITGILYDRPVSRTEYETRWTLQITDQNPPAIAHSLASRIV